MDEQAAVIKPAHATPDMSLWQGRIDPEPNSERWHQRITAYHTDAAAGTVLTGFASDAGVARNKGRIGAAAGPTAIRQALGPMAWHHDTPVYDAGDVACHGDGLEHAQQRMGEHLTELLDRGHLPVVLGGGHEVAYASWRGLSDHLAQQQRRSCVAIINLDAHFDLRDPSELTSSGTPFAQIAADCASRRWPFRYACLGVSQAANTRALFHTASRLKTLVVEDREFRDSRIAFIKRDVQRLVADCDHVYLSIDMDVFPASDAPGVSAPASRGVILTHLEPILEFLRRSRKLRLIDIAEVNPAYDIDQRTARLAARLVHQLTRSDH
ncbi:MULTISPECIES: formimidoylglutamase [Halomonas]|uniref:formimidoylglutamase n=1 Tax=Halomonas TaxID=2745 RepID=UPI001C978322|nr:MULTISPECIES: formimidoylglutamase [Halomonas]MBY6208337.1 formimidoylglutamase [Halomonas sp. DP3Y7-2]MBY6229146.1 formimidoylglutamase [Halomonas sp. DP3Y7-1]MCA0916871.1 formimidoylglutamase [Halomonas denitrificans]